jgi:hypothetical protein
MFFNLYDANTASIEVVYNDKLLTINFPILPICFLLDIEIRQKFIEEMDRSHHDKKLKYIVESSKFLFFFVNTRYNFNKALGKINLLMAIFKHIYYWKEVLYLCTYLANAFIVISFSRYPQYKNIEIINTEGLTREEYIRLHLPSLFTVDNFLIHKETIYAFNCIGAVQIFVFIVVFIHHLFNNMWTQFKIMKSQYSEKKLNTIRNVFYLFRWIHRPLKRCDLTNLIIFLKLFQDFETIYLIISCMFTVFGLLYHPFFYIFNLTNLFYRHETLKILVTSLYISRQTLSNILILYCIILYIFALINFVHFWDQYEESFFCFSNMYQCFFAMLQAPFKNTDTFFLIDKTNKDPIFDTRFLFDTFYNILMIGIYIVLFPALMIDTFKFMSNKAKINTYDKLNVCSICNYDRREIEYNSANYNEHIYIKHNLWNYVYFITYLLSKPTNELNTLQKYLLYQINNNRHNWIPSKSKGYEISSTKI